MSWFAFIWKLFRDTVFRKAVRSILWDRIGYPFIVGLSKNLFQAGYEIVLRSVQTTEEMYLRKEITKEEKPRVCLELIDAEAKAKSVDLSLWAKNHLREIALGELEKKWEEFK